jgi:hypothetical protein
MICESCEKMRSQIENRGIDVVNRRGWVGPPTISDDALMLEIQRRLWGQDHRALKEQERANSSWAKRAARAQEQEQDNAEPEQDLEDDFAEAAE